MERIIVTGATSMIGVATIEACLDSGIKTVYAVVRPNSNKVIRLPQDKRVVVIKCDADRYSELSNLISEKCDVFYHFAWRATGAKRNDSFEEQINNIRFTVDAVGAAKLCGCSKFVGAGSQAEYGNLEVEKICFDSPVNPTQPYGIAKLAAGKMAKEKADVLGIECVWVRIFSVYGPDDKPNTMISTTLSKLMRAEHISLTEGIQKWDYLFSKDAGEALCRIGQYDTGSKVYCLGSGCAKPLREYVVTMKKMTNSKAELGFGEIPYSKHSVMNLCADITPLTRDIGWTPTTSFEEGILRILGGANLQI